MRRASIVFSLLLFAGIARGDDRLFVRTSSDGLETEIGGHAVGGATHSIRFTLVQADVERWPEPVTITIAERVTGFVWTATLDSQFAIKPHILRVPRGTYDLTFAAAHHRPVARGVTLTDAGVTLGKLNLIRHPVISGRIRTADGSPVAGAFVTDRGDHSTKTDGTGLFALEIANAWPSVIEISYPGLTSKEIPIQKQQASVTLPDLVLFKGSRLVIEIEGLADDAEVDLASEREYQRVEVRRTVKVSRSAPRIVFEDLDPGEHLVIVRGKEPLQKLATLVLIGEAAASVTKTIRVAPLTVEIDVHRGESPAANALVNVQSEGNRWSSEVRMDEDGRMTGEAWQRGSWAFAVRISPTSVPVLLIEEIEGTTKAAVHLSVPERTITGRVIDAESGEPIGGASVEVAGTHDDETAGTATAITGPDGKFVVDGLRDGSHTVEVQAGDYLRSEPVTVRLDQTLPRRDVSVRLSHGMGRSIRVVTRGGMPIADAMVIAAAGDAVTAVLKTDAFGFATVRLQQGAGAVLYVVPLEGSFAIARLRAKAAGDPETIVVPDGTATLELRAKDSEGNGIAHLEFVMRYDGELIPPDVADLLMVRRGMSLVTGTDGVARLNRLPLGLLELWPARGRIELADIAARGGPAPVRITLKDGLNVASMTFVRRR